MEARAESVSSLPSSCRMADTSWSTGVDDPAVYVASVDVSGHSEDSWMTPPSAAYAAGHLFYSRGAGVFARPFDAERLEFSGAEVQVTARAGGFSVSDDGTIVYRPAGSRCPG